MIRWRREGPVPAAPENLSGQNRNPSLQTVALLVQEGHENAIALAKAALAAAVVTRDDSIPALTAALNQLVTELKQTAVTEASLAAILLRVKDEAAPRPAPVRPEGVALAYGGEAGKIKAMCHSQRGIADYYQARWTTTDPTLPATTWTIYPTPSSRATFSLTGLPSGQMVWVQIRAGKPWPESQKDLPDKPAASETATNRPLSSNGKLTEPMARQIQSDDED